jgi:hypothetical protein
MINVLEERIKGDNLGGCNSCVVYNDISIESEK